MVEDCERAQALSDNLEELLGGDEALALQGAPNEFNDVGGQVGEVADGLVLDLAVLAITAPQQVSGVGLVLSCASVS